MTSGIYLITNTVTGEEYVGQSVRIEARWHSHQNDLNAGHHRSCRLQRAWQRYGANAFTFEILEEVPYVVGQDGNVTQVYEQLHDLEALHIKQRNPVYNQQIPAQHVRRTSQKQAG